MNCSTAYYDRDFCCFLHHIESGFDTPLIRFPFTIGRSEACHLHIVKNAVSRVHAIISKDKQGLSISNISSINHVKINHQRIDRWLLVEGDLVSIAGERYRYHENIQQAAVQKTGPVIKSHKFKIKAVFFGLLLLALIGAVLITLLSTPSPAHIKPVRKAATETDVVYAEKQIVQLSIPDLPVVKVTARQPKPKHAPVKAAMAIVPPTSRLVRLYQRGLSAYYAGQQERAFALWAKYLSKENQLSPDYSIELSIKIKNFVIDTYSQRAQLAAKLGNKSKAYSYWQKIVQIDPDNKARQELKYLDDVYQSLVGKAIKAQTSKARDAMRAWKLVADGTPEDHYWHHKALAKLKLYESKAKP